MNDIGNGKLNRANKVSSGECVLSIGRQRTDNDIKRMKSGRMKAVGSNGQQTKIVRFKGL